MSEIGASQLLSQLRSTAELAQGVKVNKIDDAPDKVDFSQFLKNAVDHVNETSQQSGDLKKAFQVGDPNIDIAQVMVASQKANIEFQLMLNVRNRLLSAYQDVMKMAI